MTADTCFQASGTVPDAPIPPRQGERFPLDPAAKDFLQPVRKKDAMKTMASSVYQERKSSRRRKRGSSSGTGSQKRLAEYFQKLLLVERLINKAFGAN